MLGDREPGTDAAASDAQRGHRGAPRRLPVPKLLLQGLRNHCRFLWLAVRTFNFSGFYSLDTIAGDSLAFGRGSEVSPEMTNIMAPYSEYSESIRYLKYASTRCCQSVMPACLLGCSEDLLTWPLGGYGAWYKGYMVMLRGPTQSGSIQACATCRPRGL